VIVVGVAGGIGSGKTAVTDQLAAVGAVIVDADVIAKQILSPGSSGLQEVLAKFGVEILTGEGALDRQKLAALVFSDDEARLALNAITHPKINDTMLSQIAEVRDEPGVCIVAIPLLVPEHRARLGLDAVVVVDCPIDLALERLTSQRDFARDDALARIAAQMSRAERCEMADYVVVNDGDRQQLSLRVDDLWRELNERAEALARG